MKEQFQEGMDFVTKHFFVSKQETKKIVDNPLHRFAYGIFSDMKVEDSEGDRQLYDTIIWELQKDGYTTEQIIAGFYFLEIAEKQKNLSLAV